jgi:predicted RNA-binding protein associated with RNAse of E/G family
MTGDGYFPPGQTVLLREVVHGRVWSAKPGIVVQDSPDLVALYAPPGTMIRQPRTPDMKRVKADNRLRGVWTLEQVPWSTFHILRLALAGVPYSVMVFWEKDFKFRDWYINLEDPLHRVGNGFEYLDQWLDVIVAPDRKSWRWKDEDEFAEAVLLKLISPGKARDLRLAGEEVAAWIQTGESPFNKWVDWRPDPSWQTPVLPVGWDVI